MKQIKREITTYEVGNGFYVDVEIDIEDEEIINFWIYHNIIGIKSFMYGLPITGYDKTNYDDLIELNIKLNIVSYIEHYKIEYMSE